MKLTIRTAGICASGAFIVTALPAFFKQWDLSNPIPTDTFAGMGLLESLALSLVGALIAGIIGFQIGKVLSKPAGKKKKKKPTVQQGSITDAIPQPIASEPAAPAQAETASSPSTGSDEP